VKVNNLNELTRLAADLRARLEIGDVIFLTGPLGAGKTTFVQKLFRLYGVPETAVTSPTFSLIERYTVNGRELLHADCYRLPGNDEAILAELAEAAETAALLAIEWPQKMPALAEKFQAWQIALQELPDGGREVVVTPPKRCQK